MDATTSFLLVGGAAALAVRARFLSCEAPVAARRPAVVRSGEAPGGGLGDPPRGVSADRLMSPAVERPDDLSWLRDDTRTDATVLGLLRAENAHTAGHVAHLQGARERLAAELKSRLQETDCDVPYAHGPFLYYTRTVEGLSYPLHCRRPKTPAGAPDAEEEVLLDENALASGNAMCDVASMEVSPDGALLCYAVDYSGSETYTLRFKRLDWRAVSAGANGSVVAERVTAGAGDALPDVIPDTAGDIEWDGAGTAIFYSTLDSAHRPHRIHRHVLGTPSALDECLMEERDERFWLGMSRSLTGDVLFVEAGSKRTSEVTAIALTPRAEAALANAPRAARVSAIEVEVDAETEQDDVSEAEAVDSERESGKAASAAAAAAAVKAEAAAADAAAAAFLASGHAPSRPPLPLAIVVAKRKDGVLYSAEHMRREGAGADDALVISTNSDDAVNLKVAVAPMREPSAWVDVVPHSPALYITGVAVFRDFWAIDGREGGYAGVWLARGEGLRAAVNAALNATGTSGAAAAGAASGESTSRPALALEALPPRERVFVLGLGANAEYDASTLRFTYSSMTTPTLTCELRADAIGGWSWDAPAGAPGAITVLKRKAAPNVDPSLYRCLRSVATAADGARVPISILYRPSAHAALSTTADDEAGGAAVPGACPLPKPAPLLLYAYGSYGHSIDPYFSSSLLSFADRGVVYAIAHIRGGGEMGRSWYEKEGKLLAKKNTFSDYIACAEHLVAEGWTAKGRIGAQGGSAGGLLMGAVANARPDLWAGVLAEVPFVDVLTTMSDPTIPLTVTEWEEWGNPNETEYYEYIKSYSPVDNVVRQRYAPMLLEGGLHDSRVAYWEPVKFAQRVRAAHLGSPSDILCKIEMDEGHAGAMDRYVSIKQKAFSWSWLLHCLGVAI